MTGIVPIGAVRPDATQVVCCAHAGGGPMAFRDWGPTLRSVASVWAVTLPGRASRIGEPFAHSWSSLIDEFVQELVGLRPARLVLFGHSLGGLVAFELARGTSRMGVPPAHLVIAACGAPDLSVDHVVPDGDEELLELVDRRYGGVPDVLRRHPEVTARYLPVLRADLALAGAYHFRSAPRLECPITVLGGDGDELAPPYKLAAWSQHTCRSCSVRIYRAGHFFPDRQLEAMAELLRDAEVEGVCAA